MFINLGINDQATFIGKDKTMDNFKRDWILDAMEHGKMTREEAEHCWQQQEYREG